MSLAAKLRRLNYESCTFGSLEGVTSYMLRGVVEDLASPGKTCGISDAAISELRIL